MSHHLSFSVEVQHIEMDMLYKATVCLPHTGPVTHEALVHRTIRHLQIGSCSTFSQSLIQNPNHLYLLRP